MAAPIRIRVTQVRLGNTPLNEYIDPFWLHVTAQELPFINDVGERILFTCNRSFISRQRPNDDVDDDGTESADTDAVTKFRLQSLLTQEALKSENSSQTSCQLWLDGCILPGSERTEILRDNDSITATILQHDFKKDDRASSLCDKKMIETLSRKRKRPKSVDHHNTENDLEGYHLEKKTKDKKHKKKRHKMEENCDGSVSLCNQHSSPSIIPNVSSFEEPKISVSHTSSSNRLKPESNDIPSKDNSCNDKKKEKKRRKKEMCEGKSKKSILSPSFDGNTTGTIPSETGSSENMRGTPSSSGGEISQLEAQKRKLLGKLDMFVQSGALPGVSKIDHDELNMSLNDRSEASANVSMETQHKRRRRRKKKKSNDKEESKSIVRIEDKPRSSVLNLPWDIRPKNSKITFDSDSGDDKGGEVDMKINVKDDDGAEHNETMNKIKVVAEEVKGEMIDDKKSVKKWNGDSLESQARAASKSYKDLTPTCRKYLMRSTIGILDSLRSPSVADKDNSLSVGVSTKRHEDSISNSSGKNKPLTPIGKVTETIELPVNSGAADAIRVETGRQSFSEFKSPISSQMLEVDRQDRYSKQTKAVSSPNSSVRKYNNVPPPSDTNVDNDAKFNELLQRRRLNSTQCSVRKSENGITICSRNKSPKWNSQIDSNGFADPAVDVLTNVSTVKEFKTNHASFDVSEKTTIGNRTSGCKGDTQQGKVEVIPLDVEKCPPLSGNPYAGDILAYKILEMNADYTPVVSDFKTAKVLSFEGGTITLELFGSPSPKKPRGKFDLVYDDDEEETTTAIAQIDEKVSVELASMMDTRLVQRYTDKET